MEFITDIVVGLNLILIFGSVFLALEIFRSLGMKETYVLAKAWRYLVPAIFLIAVIRIYNFFLEYSVYTAPRLVHELLYLAFNVILFVGLLEQYLAIKKAMEGRG